MDDDTDDTIGGSGVTPDGSAVFQVDAGFVCLPGGIATFCAKLGADAVQIDHDGTVWCLDAVEQEWLTAERKLRRPEVDATVTMLPAPRGRQ